MDGEVETVAVSRYVMWREIKGGEDNIGWGADREGELVDNEMRRGEERRGIRDGFGDFKC